MTASIFKVTLVIEGRTKPGYPHAYIEANDGTEARDISIARWGDRIHQEEETGSYSISAIRVPFIPNNDTAPFIKSEKSVYDRCWVDNEPYGKCAHPIGYEPMPRSQRAAIELEAEAAWARAALSAANRGRVLDSDAILRAILDGIEHHLKPARDETMNAPYVRKQDPEDNEPMQPAPWDIKWEDRA